MSDKQGETAVNETIEAIQARRAERKSGIASAKKVQYAIDLAALDSAEAEYGDERIRSVDLNCYHEGLPTMLVLRCPTKVEFKRWQDRLKRSKQEDAGARIDAANEIATACVVYPPKDVLAKVLEVAGGSLLIASNVVIEMFSAEQTERGKG